MATIFYTTGNDYYRCRCDYNVSLTDTAVTISGTIYLQHKGSAISSIWFPVNAGIGYHVESTDTTVSIRTDSVKSVEQHTDWTNIKSKTFSFQSTRTHSDATQYLYTVVENYIEVDKRKVSATARKSVTIPAKPSYEITYNANGGGTMPSNGKKYAGETYYIYALPPTRSGYAFKCWNTKVDGTGTNYSPTQAYETDAALTLYAQWYAIPVITSVSAIRCNAQGEDDPYGEYAFVACQWSIASGTATLTGKITPQGGTATAFTFSSSSTGTGGTATALISASNGLRIDGDTQYIIEITATNNAYSTAKTSVNEILTRAFYIMDWKAGGLGVGIGRAAPDTGLEIGYEVTFDDDVYILIDTTVTSGTDKEIYDALVSLGWDSDVII